MNRNIIFIISLLGLTIVGSIPYTSFGKCSFTGDPHLIPFTNSSNMYFCQTPGWQILLQNKWVFITVQIGPSPYVVLNYIVYFYKADGNLACVLIGGSSGYTTCPISSSIISYTSSGGTSWNHNYPLAEYLNLQISSYPWGSGERYDIIIRQTNNLISQSTGVCIKFNCPLERVLFTPPPVIIKICDIYINTANKGIIGRVNENTVKYITIACQNDLTLSFNPQIAQTAVVQIIHSSLDQITGEDYQNAVIKADGNIRSALVEADRSAADLLNQGDTCFEQKQCLINNKQ